MNKCSLSRVTVQHRFDPCVWKGFNRHLFFSFWWPIFCWLLVNIYSQKKKKRTLKNHFLTLWCTELLSEIFDVWNFFLKFKKKKWGVRVNKTRQHNVDNYWIWVVVTRGSLCSSLYFWESLKFSIMKIKVSLNNENKKELPATFTEAPSLIMTED